MSENIKLIPLNCPNYGAVINLPENSKFGYCEYCSSQLRYDDGTRSYSVVDQSEIERILLEKNKKEHVAQVRDDKAEHRNKSLLSVQKWWILVFVFHAIFMLLSPTIYLLKSVVAAILILACWVIMPIVLAVLKPRDAWGSRIGVFFLFGATFTALFYIEMLIIQAIR